MRCSAALNDISPSDRAGTQRESNRVTVCGNRIPFDLIFVIYLLFFLRGLVTLLLFLSQTRRLVLDAARREYLKNVDFGDFDARSLWRRDN